MKLLDNLLIVIVFLFSSAIINNVLCQDEPIKPMAEFSTTTFDFGKIEYGKPVNAIFKVKNTSLVPLIIERVKPTCGCTVANYTKEPIRPGESGEIIATYNAKGIGPFTKTVYVKTNASEQNVTLLMKGEVLKSK